MEAWHDEGMVETLIDGADGRMAGGVRLFWGGKALLDNLVRGGMVGRWVGRGWLSGACRLVGDGRQGRMVQGRD